VGVTVSEAPHTAVVGGGGGRNKDHGSGPPAASVRSCLAPASGSRGVESVEKTEAEGSS